MTSVKRRNVGARPHAVYHRRMEASAHNVTAFILAGGKSTRMGRDKAFVEYDGSTFLARALVLAHSVSPDVFIVGSHETFSVFAPVVEDVFRDCGPLGGIHAGLRATSTDLNLMLAVDMPFLPAAFLPYLIDEARSAPAAMVILPRESTWEGANRWQPLCAVYRPAFADTAEAALLAGRNKIDLLFERVRIHAIDEENLKRAGFSPAIFRNLNTPEELKAESKT